MCVASFNDSKIAWYENDGSGNFGIQQIITTDASRQPLMPPIWTTMEMGRAVADNKIAWYENLSMTHTLAERCFTIPTKMAYLRAENMV